MASEWVEVPIGELAEIFDGPHATPAKTSDGPIFLGISNLANGRIDLGSTAHVSEEDFKRWTRRIEPRAGDVVFSYETRLGEAAIIPSGLRCCLGRRMGLLRARTGKVDERFLLYAYLGPQFQEILRARTIHGSTVDRIPLIEMSNFPIVVPESIEEQRAIAHILGTLDEKIELNRRMSETLETIARALFKSWFVDFDPVRSKAEGREPGLSKPLADLFPDRLVESELGEIPDGWEVRSLVEVTEKPQYGFTTSAASERVGPRFLRITDINKNNWIDWERVPYCEIGDEAFEKYRLRTGDIVMARMADPGHGALIEEDVAAVFASYLVRFRPRRAELRRYLQYWLRSETYWQLVVSHQSGTTRANLNAQELGRFPLVIPQPQALIFFSSCVDTVRKKIVSNVGESGVLSSLRDTLLPTLLSGEMRIRDPQHLLYADE